MQRYYRKLVFNFYRRFRHPRHLKNNRLLRWFSRHFLDKTVWKPTRHTFAGGLAVGLFVMSLLIPGQMPVAVVIAALLRVNIPIAIMACWITNPVTMAPAAWWEIELGSWIMRTVGLGTPPTLEWEVLKQQLHVAHNFMDYYHIFKPWAGSVYIGGVVAGGILAPIGYALSYLLWDLMLLMTHRREKAPILPPAENG